MPTYEYACKGCGEHMEVVQSFRDDPLTTCANCGGALRKVFGAIGIAFKGSGFYRTDSRDSSSAGTKKSDAKPETKSGGEAKASGASADGAKGSPSTSPSSGSSSSSSSSSKAAASS